MTSEIKVDVLVVGGGMAGVCASLAVRRLGHSAALIEKANLLGGCTSLCLVQPWQGFFTSGTRESPHGRQIIFGIAKEIVDELVLLSASLGHIPDPIGFAGRITPVNTSALSIYLVHKLREEGVRLFTCARLVKAITRGTRIIKAICEAGGVEPKERVEIAAKCFIDASGSAVLIRLAGEELIIPESPQAWTHIFTMAGVDEEEIREYILKHPKEFVLSKNFKDLKPAFTAVSGFFELVKKAREKGKFPCPRDRLLFFGTTRTGELTINTTRVFPPKNFFKRSWKEQAIISSRLKEEAINQVYLLERFLREAVPGFKHAEIDKIASEVGIRESYRLKGRKILRGKEALKGKVPRDSVALSGYPVDVHPSGSIKIRTAKIGGEGFFGIPIGALLPRKIENLLAAGRIISTDSDAFASIRITASAMAIGEAAGRISVKMIRREKIMPEEVLAEITHSRS